MNAYPPGSPEEQAYRAGWHDALDEVSEQVQVRFRDAREQQRSRWLATWMNLAPPSSIFTSAALFASTQIGQAVKAVRDLDAPNDAPSQESDPEYVYGALARAEALAAGREDWMTVTRWPLS